MRGAAAILSQGFGSEGAVHAPAAGAGRIAGERVDEALRVVLARPEFRPSEAHPFLDWLQGLFSRGPAADADLLARGLALAVGIGLSLLFAWAFVRLLGRSGKRAGSGRASAARGPLRSSGALPVSPAERVRALLADAARARAGGASRLALRLYFTALVVGLGEAGDLEYRDAWTNRELLARGRPDATWRPKLAALVEEIDARSFGAHPTSAADVERVRALCTEVFGGGVA